MKVFCRLCTEHIFDTTDRFVIGGPYNGEMFKAPTIADSYRGSYLDMGEWRVQGDLFCPRCEQDFIQDGLLTEHGIIRDGQKSLDLSFPIVNPDGSIQSRNTFSKEQTCSTCDKCGRTFATEQGLRVHSHTCKGVKDA